MHPEAGVRRVETHRHTLEPQRKVGVCAELPKQAFCYNRKKMADFDVAIADGHLSWQRRIEQIAEEGRLDGIYGLRTGVPAEHLDAAETGNVRREPILGRSGNQPRWSALI